MKIFHFISFLTIILEILSQQQNSNNNETLQNITQSNPINNQQNSNNKQNKSIQDIENTIQNLNQTQINRIYNIIKEMKNTNKTKNKSKKEKQFTLTEALGQFFNEILNESKKEKNQNNTNNINNTKEDEEIKKDEEEKQEKIKMDIEREKRREIFEARDKAEFIKLENEKKEIKKKKEQEERAKFENILSNTTFKESLIISLEKGETETFFLYLNSFIKVKIAIVLTDKEDKINFVMYGPNAKGNTSKLYRVYDKNYLFYEFETLRKGEYIFNIFNRENKEIELIFFLNTNIEKKKDMIKPEKIDKISKMLNDIDNNIKQLRNKKRIEIIQVNSHNEKVDKYNKKIVIYSVIEIFTMIIVFSAQSYYISSILSKV